MKAMTYGDLLIHLQSLDPHELEMTATVYLADVDEFIPLSTFLFSDEENDVLDEGHPYIMSLHEPEVLTADRAAEIMDEIFSKPIKK
jgi:hypothetical protein